MKYQRNPQTNLQIRIIKKKSLRGRKDFQCRYVYQYLTEMLNNGLIDSIGENHNLGFAFWFLICGIILILWGETLQYYIRKEQKPAPLFLGYFILLFTIIGCIVEPISGFWLFLPQALIIIYSNMKKQ